MIWKEYVNENEYYINYSLWSYYELIKDNIGNISSKYNIEQVEIYNGLTDEVIYVKQFEEEEYYHNESLK